MSDNHLRRLIDYCKRKLIECPFCILTGHKEPYITAVRIAKEEVNGNENKTYR